MNFLSIGDNYKGDEVLINFYLCSIYNAYKYTYSSNIHKIDIYTSRLFDACIYRC